MTTPPLAADSSTPVDSSADVQESRNADPSDGLSTEPSDDGTAPPSPTADQPNALPTQASGTTANQDAAINTAGSDAKVLEPGDDGYDANSDPVIPSSQLAQVVAAELEGSGESPTRDALVAAREEGNVAAPTA